MFWKVHFYPWVHRWTLQTRMIHFVSIKDISKYTNLVLTIPSLGERWHFDPLISKMKVQFLISWSFVNFSFSHWSIFEHFKQVWDTLLQSKISRNKLICFWRFHILVNDDLYNTKYNLESPNYELLMFWKL